MPRLIAIDGPETGLALPLFGPENYLARGRDLRVRLFRGGDPPPSGAAIRSGGESFWIERLGPAGDAAAPLIVNGEEIERAALQHGDIISFAGTTLIFDCDDFDSTETTPGEKRLAGPLPAAAGGPGRAGGDAERSPSEGATARPLRPREGEAILFRQKAYDDASALVRGVAGKEPGARRLATLLRTAAACGATLELGSLLKTLLDLIFEELPADRGTILLLERPAKKLRPMVARSREGDFTAAPRISRTIVREALRLRESILTLDAMTDQRFRHGESVVAGRIRSAMCVPIVRSGRVLGAIQVDTTERTRAFSRDDLDLLTAIASMAALAIDNARLYQDAAERERLRCELALASAIQGRLLPKTQPETPDLDVYGTMVPAKELGGDYFDFVEDRARGDLHIFVGDVSGKGVGAGLVMAIARSYFRPLALAYDSPRKVLAEVNRLLYEDTNREMFMSAIYLRWDGAARRLVYAGAGQEHLLLVRASGAVEAIPAGGMALALVDDAAPYLEDKELPLGAGDLVLLYSDGVTESREPGGAFFGLERLRALLAGTSGLSAREVVERVLAEVVRFQASAEQHDDITVVALKRK
jgi:serine phosphatase RsbU (regulator of sigma subunit)